MSDQKFTRLVLYPGIADPYAGAYDRVPLPDYDDPAYTVGNHYEASLHYCVVETVSADRVAALKAENRRYRNLAFRMLEWLGEHGPEQDDMPMHFALVQYITNLLSGTAQAVKERDDE